MPLIKSALKGFRFCSSPVQADLQKERLALAPATPECFDGPPQLFRPSVDRKKTVRPPPHQFGAGLGYRRSQQQRRVLGQGIKLPFHDGHSAVVSYCFSLQQSTNDGGAFTQAFIAFRLLRPSHPSKALVQSLPTAKGEP